MLLKKLIAWIGELNQFFAESDCIWMALEVACLMIESRYAFHVNFSSKRMPRNSICDFLVTHGEFDGWMPMSWTPGEQDPV